MASTPTSEGERPVRPSDDENSAKKRIEDRGQMRVRSEKIIKKYSLTDTLKVWREKSEVRRG